MSARTELLLIGVSRTTWMRSFEEARAASSRIAQATSRPDEMPNQAGWSLTLDGLSGFGVANGELVGLFSLVRGRGDELMRHAVAWGADHLDCFDGYLVDLYSRHGFIEERREPNWTPGEPDVVYMRRSA